MVNFAINSFSFYLFKNFGFPVTQICPREAEVTFETERFYGHDVSVRMHLKMLVFIKWNTILYQSHNFLSECICAESGMGFPNIVQHVFNSRQNFLFA